jgi:hypothetical protein
MSNYIVNTYCSADIHKRGGASLLNQHYKGSLIKALSVIYPEYQWDVSKFKKVPRNFWRDRQNQIDFFNSLAKELNIRNMEEWSTVRSLDVRLKGGSTILGEYYSSSLTKALVSLFPGYKGGRQVFQKDVSQHSVRVTSKRQYYLFKVIQTIFPQEEIYLNYSALRYRTGSRKMELDIFIPSLSLAFEYQGKLHKLTFITK